MKYIIILISILFIKTVFATEIDCKNKSEEECYSLTVFSLEKESLNNKIERNYSKLIKIYEIYCEANFSKACLDLAHKYNLGLGVNQDFDKAINFYKKASDLGSAEADMELGNFYSNEKYLKKDKTKTKYFYEKACLKNKSFCFMIDNFEKKFSKEEDFQSIKSLEPLCSDGLRSMYCQSIASIYDKYDDFENASKYYEMSCNQTNLSGCLSYAKMFLKNHKTKLFEEKLDFACVNGEYESCLELGKFYEQQNNIKRNQYYEKACDLGFLKVCK